MKTRESRSRAARFAAALIAAPVAVLPMVLAPPASAAWIVYDPTNYAQNVLHAPEKPETEGTFYLGSAPASRCPGRNLPE